MSERVRITEGIAALTADLLAEQGPRISTMRNYRFALFQYAPEEEFELRRQIRGLIDVLQARGWGVLSIDLHQLLLDRVLGLGEDFVQTVIERERRTFTKDPSRALDYLRGKICPLIEGPDGIAADVIRIVGDFADKYPNQADRTLVLVGRAGSLYPFFRSSALLRHLDGKTRNIPVVFLYPGTRGADSALSFLGVVTPDRDYRPRIYP
jgi:hypothetical protein